MLLNPLKYMEEIMYGPKYNEIIYDVCKNHNISYEKCEENLILLECNGRKKYIWSRRFPNNPNSSCKIIDSKSLCSCVLRNNEIPSVYHEKLIHPCSPKYIYQEIANFSICEKFLEKYNKIVLKPDNSYEGTGVFICQSKKDIEFALEKIFSNYKTAAVSGYIEIINEYRLFYLEGDILFVYRKDLPYVVGDGISNIHQLIIRLNDEKLDISNVLVDLNYIPLKDEKVIISWKRNLSLGSIPQPVNDKDKLIKLSSIAKSAALAVDAHFATIDIIEDKNHNIQVLELNSGVAMDQFILQYKDGYNIAYKIYELAIHKIMFG